MKQWYALYSLLYSYGRRNYMYITIVILKHVIIMILNVENNVYYDFKIVMYLVHQLHQPTCFERINKQNSMYNLTNQKHCLPLMEKENKTATFWSDIKAILVW